MQKSRHVNMFNYEQKYLELKKKLPTMLKNPKHSPYCFEKFNYYIWVYIVYSVQILYMQFENKLYNCNIFTNKYIL